MLHLYLMAKKKIMAIVYVEFSDLTSVIDRDPEKDSNIYTTIYIQ